MLDQPRSMETMVRSSVQLRARYDNFIGGKWTTPADGRYFTDTSPIDGKKIAEVARSSASTASA